MNKPLNSLLRKTCSKCGLQKLLSAFLHSADKEGNSYSNICSSCRSLINKTANEKAEGEHGAGGSTTLEYRIDANAKIQSEIDKREQFEQKKEADKTEKKRKEKTDTDKTEKKETIAKADRKHLDTLFGAKTGVSPLPQKILDQQEQNHIKQHAERVTTKENLTKESRTTEELKNKIAQEEEQKLKSLDPSASNLDPHSIRPGEIKYQGTAFITGEAFQRFRQWLGKANPQTPTTSAPPPTEKSTAKSDQKLRSWLGKETPKKEASIIGVSEKFLNGLKTTGSAMPTHPAEELAEFIEKNTSKGPSSRRS